MYFFYFYPLGLDQRRRRRPLLSWTMMAVMVVAFLWARHFPTAFGVRPWDLIFQPGYGAPWTVVTAVFLHGGWVHLLGNLVYFQVFAPPLEDRLGPVRFLLYFLVMGTAGNLVHGITTNLGILGPRGVGVLGASGAIAGLIAFAMVRFYSARVTVAWWVLAPLGGQNRAGRSPVPLAAAAVLWLLFQVVQALVAGETGANVSFGAHLGGFFMGLVLALAMGGLGEARSDAAAGRARRYFAEGHFHAAAGAWTEYLERAPGDLEARLEQARALHVSGQSGPARDCFRAVFRAHLAAGRVPDALDVAAEACRGLGAGCLDPDDLARVAYYREKMLDDQGAFAAYEMLHGAYPEHPQGQRALVRMIVLCHGKLKDPAAAQRWLERAWLTMKPGSWRDYLEREFNLAAGPYGDSRPGSPATDPAPAP
jgi:membrane associated rhomboid family serine protease